MRGIAEEKLRLRCDPEWKIAQAKVVLIHNAILKDVELRVPTKRALLACAQFQCSTGADCKNIPYLDQQSVCSLQAGLS
jgi:hypothetical protein